MIDSITFASKQIDNTIESQISVKRVYGDGIAYCAFTSLIKKDDYYYLAFREGKTHASDGDYGVIRILQSIDGDQWSDYQTISSDNIDLRDPDLSIMPDGHILLVCGARILSPEGFYFTKTYSSIEKNGYFEEMEEVTIPKELDDKFGCWIWRTTWHTDGLGYGFAYGNLDGKSNLCLLKTPDGRNYDKVCSLKLNGSPTEARVRFLQDKTMIAMVRMGYSEGGGYMGRSNPPYDKWEWKQLDINLSGQDFIIDDNKVVVCTRIYQNTGERTSVYFGDLNGVFRWNYILPSSGRGGDSSYAGIIDNGNEYVISYYSKYEEENPSIYVVKIPKNITNY